MHRFRMITGRAGRRSIVLVGHLLGLLGLLGRLLHRTVRLVTSRDRIPWREVVRQVDRMGFGSLGVVVLAASTVGISLVFLSLEQLKNLGGLSVLAFVFAKALLREIGPVLAGVVMAVRVGSLVTLEVGSLPEGERRVSGSGRGPEPDPGMRLLPSFLAVVLVGPALYLLAAFFGFLAGVVSQTRWSADNFLQFYRAILDNFSIHDVEFGLYKTFLFGLAVVVVSGYVGWITPPRAEDLHRGTVTSIVFSAVTVLTINAFFALSYSATSLLRELQQF